MPENIIKVTNETRDRISAASHDKLCRELLHFFTRHPYTRFNRLALLHISGLSRSDRIEAALKYLVKIDFINTTSGYDLFWLTRNEPLHNMLIDEFFIAGISTDVSKRPPVFRMEMPLIPYPPAQRQS
jgi:hypothetical protein